jgi:hypothetical protein
MKCSFCDRTEQGLVSLKQMLVEEQKVLFKEREYRYAEAKREGKTKTPRGIYEITGQLCEIDKCLKRLEIIFKQMGLRW